ncbi:MAG: hypothetical protein ACRDO4_00680 [Nocardioides sp.]
MGAKDVFVGHLRELWPAVSPYFTEVQPHDLVKVRQQLDEHLASTAMAGEAMLLADRLHALLDRKAEFAGDQCSVLQAAVLYFLEVDDSWNDMSAGGLADDHRVVRAAELALSQGR